MKVGDKVILRKYESNDSFFWHKDCNKHLDKEVIVIRLDYDDNSFEFLYNGDTDWWLQSACEPVKNERYFLFAYIYQGGQGSLTATNSDGKMPSYEYINQQVKVANRLSCDIGITNIYEFKSKEDYQQFNKKSE